MKKVVSIVLMIIGLLSIITGSIIQCVEMIRRYNVIFGGVAIHWSLYMIVVGYIFSYIALKLDTKMYFKTLK